MRKHTLLGIGWLATSICYLYVAIDAIYVYSTPGIYWLYMMPIQITYRRVALAVLAGIISLRYLRSHDRVYPLLMALTLLVFFYFVNDLAMFSLETLSVSWDILLVGLMLVFSLRRKYEPSLISEILIDSKRIFLTVCFLGIAPYAINRIIGYDAFSFIH